jgi:hypothetical protein
MKAARVVLLLTFACACSASAQSILDRLDDALTFAAFDGSCRVRLSGLVDIEGYHLEQPAPALIYSDRHSLFNPRLTLFLDAQLGSHIYAFAQSRVDRGFDPSDSQARMRLDEYALRFTPWDDGRFNLQVGKFSTVVGNWNQRHISWDNPFINAPLPYENLTAVWDSDTPYEASELLAWGHVNSTDTPRDIYADKRLRLPIIWGPSYATGLSVSGALGKFNYAAEVKNTALASPPYAWELAEVSFAHPTFNARFGWSPNPMWKFGVSGSVGSYLQSEAGPTLPPGYGLGDFHEYLLGQDIGFAWHHFQFWAEFYEVRFQVPHVGNADTFAYYLEAKYKFTPQLYGALRWNQQLFGNIRDEDGGMTPWGRDAWRVDFALGYRFTEHTQLKLQYSLLEEHPAQNRYNNLLAGQFTVRF